MKKIIFLILSFALVVVSFGQQINPAPTLTKQDYLKKSKHQKTTAWVLLSSGIVLVTTGGVMNAHEVYDPNSFDKSNSTKGTPLVITGIVAMAGSIPLFIGSGKNKHRAMNLSFKNETVPQIQKNSFVYKTIPSLSFKINL